MPNVISDNGKNSGQAKGGHANLRRVMDSLKKRNRANYTNKRLALVKLDA